jgi:hypothetical protein
MTTTNTPQTRAADPRPIPGAIDGLPWTVTEGAPIGHVDGTTDLSGRTMRVLHRTSHAARWVAQHELGHARWTPRASEPRKVAKANPPASENDVQIMEDCRILSLLRDAGLAQIPRHTAEEIAAQALDWFERADAMPGTPFRPQILLAPYAMLCLQSLAVPTVGSPSLDLTPAGQEVKLLRHHLTRLAKDAADAAGRDADADVGALHAVLNHALDIATSAASMLRPARRPGSGRVRLPFRAVGPAAAYFRRRLTDAQDIPPGNRIGCGRSRDNRQSLRWGKLETMPALPMTEHAAATAAQRRTLAVPAGSRLGQIRRSLTDGRCYRRTVQRLAKGGTVLIDTSGSMHLDPEQVHAVLAALPAATVAIYSGTNDKGTVSIIAKGGKCASADAIANRIEDAGTGNIVDGPALRWLATQAEPRLWVCDGIVTGCGDAAAAHLDDEAGAIVARHRITRCEDMSALRAHISKEAR